MPRKGPRKTPPIPVISKIHTETVTGMTVPQLVEHALAHGIPATAELIPETYYDDQTVVLRWYETRELGGEQ